jgi:hypothetical protein
MLMDDFVTLATTSCYIVYTANVQLENTAIAQILASMTQQQT